MTVESELDALSNGALKHMIEGLEREMQRLCYSDDLHRERDNADWPHAAWKACAIMHRAIQTELKSRL